MVRVPKTHRIDDQRISKTTDTQFVSCRFGEIAREAISTHFPAEYLRRSRFTDEIMQEILPKAFDNFRERIYIIYFMIQLKSHDELTGVTMELETLSKIHIAHFE